MARIELRRPGIGANLHTAAVWIGTAYLDGVQIQYGTLGKGLRSQWIDLGQCIGRSPVQELQQRAHQKLGEHKGYAKFNENLAAPTTRFLKLPASSAQSATVSDAGGRARPTSPPPAVGGTVYVQVPQGSDEITQFACMLADRLHFAHREAGTPSSHMFAVTADALADDEGDARLLLPAPGQTGGGGHAPHQLDFACFLMAIAMRFGLPAASDDEAIVDPSQWLAIRRPGMNPSVLEILQDLEVLAKPIDLTRVTSAVGFAVGF